MSPKTLSFKNLSNTISRFGPIFPCLALVLALATSGPAHSQVTVTSLGHLGGNYSDARGVNNTGQVVGSSATALPSVNERAFLYDGSVMTDLGTLGGSSSSAMDINDVGQVVGGSSNLQGRSRAFVYQGGIMTDLGTLPGDTSSFASAINNAGQIVGISELQNGVRSFLYSGGVMTDISSPDTLRGIALALDINNSGQVVGANNSDRAGLYSDGVFYDLGTFGGVYSSAEGINDAGQIVGFAETTSGDWHAMLYNGGPIGGFMMDIGTLGGSNSIATDINNFGQIVGYSDTSTPFESRAFLYQGGEMIDLNSLIDPASGWLLHTAWAINDHGQIVGSGSYNGQAWAAFMMTVPVPEPSSAMLCLVGLVVIVLNRRRQFTFM